MLCLFSAWCSLGPPAGHQLAVFIDDIHLPEKEQYGAVPALEMLRLLLDKGGLFQRWVSVGLGCGSVLGQPAPSAGCHCEGKELSVWQGGSHMFHHRRALQFVQLVNE